MELAEKGKGWFSPRRSHYQYLMWKNSSTSPKLTIRSYLIYIIYFEPKDSLSDRRELEITPHV